jgi:hypothetical protein
VITKKHTLAALDVEVDLLRVKSITAVKKGEQWIVRVEVPGAAFESGTQELIGSLNRALMQAAVALEEAA